MATFRPTMAAISSSGRVHRHVVVWVYGPWAAASLVLVIALRLLIDSDFNNRGHGWGMLGSGAICFSIGCVCKVSWELARLKQQQRR